MHKKHRLKCFTGTVQDVGRDFAMFRYAKKNMATAGKWAPAIQVTANTKGYDYIFIKDNLDTERQIDLKDFDIAFREGHGITIISEYVYGNPIAIINNTTGQISFASKKIFNLFHPPHWVAIIFCVAIIALSIICGAKPGVELAVASILGYFFIKLIFYQIALVKTGKIKAALKKKYFKL